MASPDDNVVEIALCALCKQPLKNVLTDAVELDGRLVHRECVNRRQEKNNSSYT